MEQFLEMLAFQKERKARQNYPILENKEFCKNEVFFHFVVYSSTNCCAPSTESKETKDPKKIVQTVP